MHVCSVLNCSHDVKVEDLSPLSSLFFSFLFNKCNWKEVFYLKRNFEVNQTLTEALYHCKFHLVGVVLKH